MRTRLIILVTLVALAFSGLVAGGRWYQRSIEPLAASETEQLLRIEEGMSSAEIAEALDEAGLVKSGFAFRLYLRLHGVSGDIQAGLYRLKPGLTAAQIAAKLSSGDTAVHSVTIKSGTRLDQLVKDLVQIGYMETEVNAALAATYPYSYLEAKPAGVSLEGYIFPDTYRVEIDTPVAQVIDLMLANTESKLTPQLRQAWAARGLSLHQGLTLASIVQKEASRSDDQRQVAQVFLKRLRIGMRLESDVTFEYGAVVSGQPASPDSDSPYNTYKIDGLPPGPIASVSSEAMAAVANPADTDWLYFLSDKEGNTHFSTDQSGHEENIQKYLR
jgi:UPF0755 protein